jgi:hypothetical protein
MPSPASLRERHKNSRSPTVLVAAPVVAATAEEAANLQVIRFLKGGTPPEGSGINEVFKATDELYAHVMARLGSEPNIRPLQRSTSEGSSLRSRSVPGRRLQPLGPRRKRRKAASVEDGLPSPGADLSHLRAIGANESTLHESVRRSAMESWRELQRDASYHTPFRRSSSRLPPISRSRPSWLAAEAEAKAAEEARLAAEEAAAAKAAGEARLAAEADRLDLLRMSVFSLGSGSPSTRHTTHSHTRRELHWSPDGRLGEVS